MKRLPPCSRGGSLVVALSLMVAMAIAAVAMARMVGTDLLLAGNAAFREGAVLASDAGIEAAVAWLSVQARANSLLQDQPAQGYYASVPDALVVTGADNPGDTAGSAGDVAGNVADNIEGDITAIDWDGDQCAGRQVRHCVSAASSLPEDAAGNRVRYTIHRLCRLPGAPQVGGNSCLAFQAPAGGSSHGQLSYGATLAPAPGERVYYRVTARVQGARNTTVFTQVLVHF